MVAAAVLRSRLGKGSIAVEVAGAVAVLGRFSAGCFPVSRQDAKAPEVAVAVVLLLRSRLDSTISSSSSIKGGNSSSSSSSSKGDERETRTRAPLPLPLKHSTSSLTSPLRLAAS